MKFYDALKALEEGKKVRRPYMKHFSLRIAEVSESRTHAKFRKTLTACAEGEVMTSFTIPNVDILADDWEVVCDIPEIPTENKLNDYKNWLIEWKTEIEDIMTREDGTDVLKRSIKYQELYLWSIRRGVLDECLEKIEEMISASNI